MDTKKICKTCGKDFIPSSRHLDCPNCRHESSKIPCPKCENLMQRTSKTCSSCMDERGNGWKGGKTLHKQSGYIQRRAPTHPSTSKNNKYVMEHRLVMEEHIGRYLTPSETVHHINGIKTDNRLENLELWTSNHPSGTRAKDLLTWAYEIIKLYGDDLEFDTD